MPSSQRELFGEDSVVVKPYSSPPKEPLPERWDVHKHKEELSVSDSATIYHPEKGQLCYCEKHWDCILYHPITFKDRAAAFKWVREGCIADLQEGLGILGIGFSLVTYQPRESPYGG